MPCPIPRPNYRLGGSVEGTWKECLNSDASEYGGSNQGSLGQIETSPVPAHGFSFSLNLVLPPLGVVFLKKKEPEQSAASPVLSPT